MNDVLKFDYCGSIIPFVFNGNDYMINTTEMAKSVCKTKKEYNAKRPIYWVRSKEAQDYIQALSNVRNLHICDLVVSAKGNPNLPGVNSGTWMHRLVAIRYAQWLEPEFAVWVDMKIDEIISNGYAFRDAEIQRLRGEVGNLNSIIQSMQPQVNYYNQVLQTTKNTYTTRDICKELGLRVSNKRLIKELILRGYAYRGGNGNKKFYLKAPWCNQGYQNTVTERCSDGALRSVTRWTESGKHWIWGLVSDWGLI